MAHRTSSSDGSGLSATSAVPTSIMAGVQNPHWSPCSSLNAFCMADSSPLWRKPSTVVTCRPSAWTANIVHAFTGLPSSRTVHTPQLVVSHPIWVPVRPARVRMRSTSRTLGSTSSSWLVPLMLTEISMCRVLLCPGLGDGLLETAPHVDPHHLALVLGRAPDVVLRIGGGRGGVGGRGEHLGAGRLADQEPLGVGRLDVARRHRREGDTGGGDPPARLVQLEMGGAP